MLGESTVILVHTTLSQDPITMSISFYGTLDASVPLLEPFSVALRVEGRRCVELWTNLPSLCSPEVAEAVANANTVLPPVPSAWHCEPAVATTSFGSLMPGCSTSGNTSSGSEAITYRVVTIPICLGELFNDRDANSRAVCCHGRGACLANHC